MRVFLNDEFVALASGHSTIVRILDEQASIFYSHFIPATHATKANAGKGIGIVCRNRWSENFKDKYNYILEEDNDCLICNYNNKLSGRDLYIKAKLQYMAVVLNRTPIKKCLSCGNINHMVNKFFTSKCLKCQELLEAETADYNKLQILSKGPVLFEQIKLVAETFGDLRTYDMRLTVKGKGLEQQILCVPKTNSKVPMIKIIGDDWKEKVADLHTFTEPLPNDIVDRIFNGGEDYFTVMAEVQAKNDNTGTL